MNRKICFSLFLIYSLCCFNLFAQTQSPEEAKQERNLFVAEAKKYVGCPYVLGACGPDSFDCSGLIYFTARESVGIQLPRTAKAIYSYCKRVPDNKREVGDLLFFKTTSNENISHVGIFIGNDQFISAISDGVNTGVIVSSLNQDYWKNKYVSTGQFIASGLTEEEMEEEVVVLDKYNKKTGNSTFKEGIVFDGSFFVDWSVFSPNQFMCKYRGLDLQINARYSEALLQPGLGFLFRFNTSQDLFQLPILFSVTINDYIRFYAGPVISFGNGTLIGTDKEISPSIFPGIIGTSLTTPFFEIAGVKFQVVQDISYSVFNKVDNSALNFVDTISAGLIMSTGIKVTLPMSRF